MSQTAVCAFTSDLLAAADGAAMRRHRHALAAIGLALLLVAAGCSAGTDSPGATTETPVERTPASETESTIHVAGSGSADAEPNQAVVRVAVEAVGADAATARRRLAAKTSPMRAALDDIGIDDDRITTERYDIYRDRRRPREDGVDPRVQTARPTTSRSRSPTPTASAK